jgi:hypothetical protein
MVRKFFHTSSDFSTMQAQCSAQKGSFELATVTQEKFKFYQWFSGLVDGEGHFSIFSSPAAGASQGKTYGFSFAIGLHKDDKETLDFIVKELGMGKISFYANSARLVISDAKSIKSLIEIFTHFPSLFYKKRSNKSVKTETIVLESSILLGIDFSGIFSRIFGSCYYYFLFPHITEFNTYIKRAKNSYIRKNNLYYFFKKWLRMGTINLLFLLCAKEYFSCDLSLLLNKKRFESNIYLTSSLKGYFSTYNRLSSIHSSIASINRVRYMATLRLSSIFSQQTLGYSTISQNQTQSISPWFISGYSDAEGCFNVGLQKNPNGKFYVRPSFQIHVHSKDNLLLMQIKAYFQNMGNIYISGEKSKFTVRSLDDILKIITHFENYPLITQKKADFILFKQIIDKVVKGEHLSAKGLQEIVNIRSSINMGISDSLKAIFPNTIPVIRPLIKTITIPHPEWMAGFVSGEGCFLVQMAKYGKGKLDGVSLSFKVSQHLRDELLLRSFISFFECGLFNYHSGKSESGSGVFIVRKFADISDKILPFFKNHVIRGIKREDFEDWARVAELIKSKAHLTEDGVKKIRAIKSGMNTLR